MRTNKQFLTEMKQAHNCSKCLGKIFCISINEFGITRCSYCNQIVNYPKATNEEMIKENFSKFELIKSIELRKNERKEKYYSFNYELNDGTFIVIVLSLNFEPPMIINAYHVRRNYKQFETSLRKNYKRKFI